MLKCIRIFISTPFNSNASLIPTTADKTCNSKHFILWLWCCLHTLHAIIPTMSQHRTTVFDAGSHCTNCAAWMNEKYLLANVCRVNCFLVPFWHTDGAASNHTTKQLSSNLTVITLVCCNTSNPTFLHCKDNSQWICVLLRGGWQMFVNPKEDTFFAGSMLSCCLVVVVVGSSVLT